MSEEITDLWEAGCGPWPSHCVRWECIRAGAGPLAPDENEFWCCPTCGCSYGRKAGDANRSGVSAEGALKPCPWCGDARNAHVLREVLQNRYFVSCRQCDSSGPSTLGELAAAALWNLRSVGSDD